MGWRFEDLRDWEKRVLNIVVTVAIAGGIVWYYARQEQHVIDGPPPNLSFREFQQLPDGYYFNVTVPQFGSADWVYGRDFYTVSLLYKDRIELRADPRLRNSKAWQMSSALGHIDADGNGGQYYFGTLNPCSSITEIRDQKGGDTKMGVWSILPGGRMAGEEHGQICLQADRLVVQIFVNTETVGEATELMTQIGKCQRGRHGGCILGNNTTPFSFDIILR